MLSSGMFCDGAVADIADSTESLLQQTEHRSVWHSQTWLCLGRKARHGNTVSESDENIKFIAQILVNIQMLQ
jgi:hypothetical protein